MPLSPKRQGKPRSLRKLLKLRKGSQSGLVNFGKTSGRLQKVPPAADVASRRPEASGTGGTGVPRWQEIDPHSYQPRPFGPMETDADWPGEDEEGEDAAPHLTTRRPEASGTSAAHPPTIDAGGERPNEGTGAPRPPANKFAPNGLRPPSPPCFA